MFSFISHLQCLLRAVLPHRHKWSLLCPSHWKEFPNPVPIGIRVASLAYPYTHIHTEKSSWGTDNSNSLALSRKPGIAQAPAFFLTSFYSSDNIEQFLLCQRNTWSLIPSWARPVRAIILILPTAKCKNPVNHEILLCYNGNLKLNTSNLFQPFNLCSRPIVRPDFLDGTTSWAVFYCR